MKNNKSPGRGTVALNGLLRTLGLLYMYNLQSSCIIALDTPGLKGRCCMGGFKITRMHFCEGYTFAGKEKAKMGNKNDTKF